MTRVELTLQPPRKVIKFLLCSGVKTNEKATIIIPRRILCQERIMETEEIQHQLQKNLESTLQEIVDLDAHIEMLKVCVKPRPFK